MTDERLIKQIVLHEGMKLKPYYDTVSKLTIGVGRNLTDVGISSDEALYLLNNDLAKVRAEAASFRWFAGLDAVRQAVVLDMLFNLGGKKFRTFQRTIAAIEAKAYKTAADRMLQSLWAKQVGARAIRLSKMMETGVFPSEVL